MQLRHERVATGVWALVVELIQLARRVPTPYRPAGDEQRPTQLKPLLDQLPTDRTDQLVPARRNNHLADPVAAHRLSSTRTSTFPTASRAGPSAKGTHQHRSHAVPHRRPASTDMYARCPRRATSPSPP